MEAVKPVQRVADFVGFKTYRVELSLQEPGLWTGGFAPVVLIHIHKHFKHAGTIAGPLSLNPIILTTLVAYF